MSRLHISIGLCLAACLPLGAAALQSTPPRPVPYAILGVRTSADEGAEPVTILLRDGRIERIEALAAAPPGYRVIEAEGLLALPAFIDASTRTGCPAPEPAIDRDRPVDERGSVQIDMREANRKGIAASFRAVDVLDFGEAGTKKHRESGFGALLSGPGGHLLGGTGALVSTRDAALRDVVVRGELLHHAAFDASGEGYPSTLMAYMAQLRQFLLDAQRHAVLGERFERGRPGERPVWDADLAAAADLLEGRERLLCGAETARDAERWIRLADEFGLGIALLGGRDVWKIAPELARREIPVLLTLDWGEEVPDPLADDSDEKPKDAGPPKGEGTPPGGEPEAPAESELAEASSEEESDESKWEYAEPLGVQIERRRRWEEGRDCALRLDEAGVRFAFVTGASDPEDLIERVRTLAEEGLSRERALAALTRTPAELLGVEHHYGSLEAGRVASIALWTDSPLEKGEEGAELAWLVLDGFPLELDVEDEPREGPAAGLDPSGRWSLEVEGEPAAEPAALVLRMRKDGRLSGTLEVEGLGGAREDVDLEGRVSGRRASWKVSFEREGTTLAWTFEGECEEDRIRGERTSEPGGESAPFEATRQAPLADEPETPPRDHPFETDAERVPSLATGGNCLIRNVVVHTAVAPAFRGEVRVEDGRIVAVGERLDAPAGTTVIDGAGGHLAPGVVDCHSHMAIERGINEGSVSISSEVTIADVVDADDITIWRALAGGVTTARLLHGSANAIGGRDVILKLRWHEDADALRMSDAPQGIKFALGENPKRSNWGERGARYPNTRMGVESIFYRAFERAREYREIWQRYREALERGADPEPPRRDLRLEVLAGILDGDVHVHSHCYRADEILMLLRASEHFGFRIATLQHVLEGYKVAHEIAQAGVGASTFSDWWGYKVEAYDAIPQNAALMHEAGISTSINSDSDEMVRRLYAEAAKSVRYAGLGRVDALALVTLNPARQLGIDGRVGSIEVGKDADLVLLNGDPLSSLSRVEWTMVEGEIEFQRRDAFGLDSAPPPVAVIEEPAREVRSHDEGAELVALVGGRLHPMTSPVVESGTLLLHGGQIVAMGADVPVPADATVFDVTGLDVWPGMLSLNSVVGLNEIGSVRATVDTSEMGGNQPDLRALASINADSEHIGVTRHNGVTRAQVTPQGRGPITGQSAVVRLDGWTWEEMATLDRDMLHVRFPATANDAEEKEEPEEVEELREMLEDAREYERVRRDAAEHGLEPPSYDPRLEALAPYARGEARVALHVSNAQTILYALEFAEDEELDVVLYGAREAWKVAPAIASAGVPVVVGPVWDLPRSEYDPYDSAFANAAVLCRAGVEFAIMADDPSNERNLAFHAATAAAFGLPPEEARRAVTWYAARVLGVEDRLGSLAVGKVADVVVTRGDLLEITSPVEMLFIEGRRVDPHGDRQTRLWRRYRERLLELQGAGY